MKKKVLAMLCVLCMVFGITGCSTEVKDEPDVVGTWEVSAVKLDGNTYVESEYLEKYNKHYSFTLSEDGTATATVLGVSYNTTYQITNGWITFTDLGLAAVKLEVIDDTLEMQLSAVGGGLVFERQ